MSTQVPGATSPGSPDDCHGERGRDGRVVEEWGEAGEGGRRRGGEEERGGGGEGGVAAGLLD